MKRIKILFIICLLLVLFINNVNAAESSDAKQKILVAMLDFRAVGVDDTLVDAIEENLATNLIMSQAFIFIERSQLDKVLGELDLSNTDDFDEDTARQIGGVLGVELVFIGSVTMIGGVTTINVRAIEVETGRARFAYKVEAEDQREILRRIEELAQTMAGTNGEIDEDTKFTDRKKPVSFKLTPLGKIGIGVAAGGGGALLVGLGLFLFDYFALDPVADPLGIVPDYSTYTSLYYVDYAMLGISIALMALGAIAVGVGIPLIFIKKKSAEIFIQPGTATRVGICFRL